MASRTQAWRRIAALGLAVTPAFAQTANSTVRGRVLDGPNGRPVEGVRVTVEAEAPAASLFRCTDAGGTFVFAALPPATYRITLRDYGKGNCEAPTQAAADRYKWREMDNLALPVAGRAEIEVRVWPMEDVFHERIYEGLVLPGSQSLVRPYGPDLDTTRTENFNPLPVDESLLDSSLSSVFSPVLVRDLPLAGRDIYNTIVLQPGATADSAAARGVGISLTGQRPTSANFLLDGVENNSYLLSGPLLAAAPESVQEYRFSSNGFSAEYGRASGVVANVVTRSGGTKWHGLFYLYAKHDVLSANDPERKRKRQDRAPVRELPPGFFLGGPLPKSPLSGSLAAERLRYRSVGTYADYTVPSEAATRFLATRPNSRAARILLPSQLQPFAGANPFEPVTVSLEPRASLDRMLYLPRIDWVAKAERLRVFVRVPIANLDRPDLEWSPYGADKVPFRESTRGAVVSATASFGPNLTLEQRIHFDAHRYAVEPPRSFEVPYFPIAGSDDTQLPGSQLGYAFRNRTVTGQAVTGVWRFTGRHFVKAGADLVFRRVTGRLAVTPAGYFGFGSLQGFLQDAPTSAIVTLACPQYDFATSNPRTCSSLPPASGYRASVRDVSFYAQDSVRVRSDLVVHGGVRVDSLGGPRGLDTLVFRYSSPPASGADVGSAERVAGTGDPLSRAHTAVAFRGGLAWAWGPNRRYLLRAGYGTFRDRLFANDWLGVLRNGAIRWRSGSADTAGSLYRGTGATGVPTGSIALASNMLAATGGFRAGWSGNGYLAAQTSVSAGWAVEVTGQISNGHALPSSNVVNRGGTLRVNRALPELFLRANQGASRYAAMTSALRYRATGAQLQISHTWSHLLDYQSDALEGLYSSIFVNPRATEAASPGLAQFAMHYSREEDWGNANFDQRHSFVLHGSWDLPRIGPSGWRRLLDDWRMAAVMAARTGFPFTVYGGSTVTQNPGIRNRATLVGGASGYRVRRPREDGLLAILANERFVRSLSGLGNLGRNSIAGPGLFNADLSLSRRWRGLLFRADWFNFLNHFNLNRPRAVAGADDFGLTGFGRRGEDTGFPALLPLVESPRQLQLMLRYEF